MENKYPNRKKVETGHEISNMISWGMLPRIETRHYLHGFILKVSLFLVAMCLAVSYLVSCYPSFSSLVNVSLGFLSIWFSVFGIVKGVQTLFFEERFKRKVIMHASSYRFDEKDVLVTVINLGDPVLIRGIDLIVGFLKKNSCFSSLIGKSSFAIDVWGHQPLDRSCFPMDKGDLWRIPESFIREGLQLLANWPPNRGMLDHSSADPDVYLIMMDRDTELSGDQRTLEKAGLISLCRLGSFRALMGTVQNGKQITKSEVHIRFGGAVVTGETVPTQTMPCRPPLMLTKEERLTMALKDILDEIRRVGKKTHKK